MIVAADGDLDSAVVDLEWGDFVAGRAGAGHNLATDAARSDEGYAGAVVVTVFCTFLFSV